MQQVDSIYELSPLQSGLFFHALYSPESTMYFEQSCVTLAMPLDVARFKRAWQYLIDRHGVLRTSFHWEDTHKPLQVVHGHADMPFDWLDWRGCSAAEQDERLGLFLEADRARGFDLSSPPLLHVTLIQRAENLYALVVSFHHLLLDGWSAQIVYQELERVYHALSRGAHPRLEPTRPYADFIAWGQKQDLVAAEKFWKTELTGFLVPTRLPLAKPHLPTNDAQGSAEEHVRLSIETTDALDRVAREHRLTLNTIIHGAYAVLLSRYTGDDDVVFGTVVSGRPADLAGVESMVGLFINTVPVRAKVGAGELLPWLHQLQERQAERTQHEWAPLFNVQSWSEVVAPTPLFHTVLAFENYPSIGQLRGPSNGGGGEARIFSRTNYPLNFAVTLEPALNLSLLYEQWALDRSAVHRLLQAFRFLLEAIALDPRCRLLDLPVMSQNERCTLKEWNSTKAPYPDLTVHQLFESRVDASPEAIAVTFEDQFLSYLDLDRRANQLARYLRSLNVGAETLVGIHLERSHDLVVAMLAVLKSGAAFVPLDPSYPRERLDFMMVDSKLSVILCHEHHMTGLPEGSLIICLDRDWPAITGQGDGRLDPLPSDGLAYVIYTSGSTGRPKGAMIEHRGLANVAEAQRTVLQVRPGDRILQFSSLSFDALVFEVMMALGAGATLCIGSRHSLAPGTALAEFIAEHAVTIILLPPSGLRLLPLEGCDCVRTVAVAGEACTGDVVERWAPGRRFINLYGSTETSIWSTFAECAPGPGPPPIGRPIANTCIYVLDGHLQPVPIGVAGELYVGGAGVGRGYLNHPGLTAERFIGDLFDLTPGARLYRTGDLVRWRADGNLEFLGRLDDQVKVRGFRIEPGEVEAAMIAHPGVAAAVVVVREDSPGDRRLVGYLVADGDSAPGPTELRALLSQHLPAYMVPSAFVVLDSLPLTPNGKVNRRALPLPDTGRPALEGVYVAPSTDTERALAEIWAEILGLEQVGIHDNFFELGGHSLFATQVVSRAREAFGVEPSLTRLFEAPTVAALADAIDTLRWAAATASVRSTATLESGYEEGRL